MSEREEKLISKINKLQKEHNSLKLESEIEKYKMEIKEVEKDIDKLKKENKKLITELNNLEDNNNINSSLNEEKIVENKKNILYKVFNDNNMMNQQLFFLKTRTDNFKNHNFILNVIKNWEPQTMFKFVRLYDKKSE